MCAPPTFNFTPRCLLNTCIYRTNKNEAQSNAFTAADISLVLTNACAAARAIIYIIYGSQFTFRLDK